MIKTIIGEGVRVIDPAPAVARQVKRLLIQRDLLATGDSQRSVRFLTSGDPTELEQLLPRLWGKTSEVGYVEWRNGRLG